jgi:diguanylate cyclase (GGDEF)-like protein
MAEILSPTHVPRIKTMAQLFSSLRIRLTLLFGTLAFLIGTAVSLYINHFVSLRMTETKGDSIQILARTIAMSISENLRERQREVGLLAQSPLLMKASFDSADSAELRKNLDRTKNTYRHYAWIGVTDAQGKVQASSDRLLEGESVAARPWFINGLKATYFGDVHEAVLLSKYLTAGQTPKPNQEPLRFVDFAAPIFDEQGKVRGVLGTHAHWRWVDEIIQRHLPADAKADAVEVFISNKQNAVLSPFAAIGKVTMPKQVLTMQGHQILHWTDQDTYLVSSIPINLFGESDQLWRVIVRQPISKALSNVSELHQKMWLLGIVTTSILMLLTYWLSRAISAPIEQLSAIAGRVAEGDEYTEMSVHSSTRELKALIASLNAMTLKLINRKRELLSINDQLEHKVEERTFELRKSNLELASLAQQLELLARQDALTGLGNRMCADEYLQQEHSRMLRTETTYCVLLMDIDYFKKVNDNYGHAVGDQVLQQVANLLKAAVRTSDLVARYGGEEFLCVLPHTDFPGATILAEKICRLTEIRPMPVGGHVTLSVGVAISRVGDRDQDEVVKRADDALYTAKANGRNQVVVAVN